MIFKKCSGCGHQWTSLVEFIADPQIRLIGYQVNFEKLEAGFFLFNHLHPKCLTTISVETEHFKGLYSGEVYRVRHTGSIQCPGYCLHTDNLKDCPSKCECSFIREVMQIVIKWPKVKAA